MDFLRRTFNDVKLRFHIHSTLFAAATVPVSLSHECLELAERHPELVVTTLAAGLNSSSIQHSHGYLELLEKLVSSCSSSFHLAMARDYALQEALVSLITMPVEGAAQRGLRHLARLTLLEYSRIFADDPNLQRLSRLARIAEKRTGRHLLRAIELEDKSVRFIDPRPQDVIVFNPANGTLSSSLLNGEGTNSLCLTCGATCSEEEMTCTSCNEHRPVDDVESLSLNNSPPPAAGRSLKAERPAEDEQNTANPASPALQDSPVGSASSVVPTMGGSSSQFREGHVRG
ncbi:hypothetical protein ERJ75_001243900 [Trypanosoma vivax]|uniref:Uncharacterized protein n=1 Tax=Trypanosoma vivax (strain Y486) TaxID=1055687 RepID=G0TWH4_TRYVY|nr:hypothetical protein TRVL_01718 [Trypanosoma vivax]KAH8608958.1 hypothetical protein ERJ75_001243900 [Trypanosoma vivax]CCC48312.1 conserved hypothetical protein [Trypanosoma vivax Y486]